MAVQTISSNIKEAIINRLNSAQFFIYAAVAWVTDEDIFNLLCKKARAGVNVELIIHDDFKTTNSINFSQYGVDFTLLIYNGGKVFLLNGNHNKYCIIDMVISISGSYNWTRTASRKEEGLEIVEINDNHAEVYEKAKHFIKLKSKSSISSQYIIDEPKKNDKNSLVTFIKDVHRLDRRVGKMKMADGSVYYIEEKLIKAETFRSDPINSTVYIGSHIRALEFQNMVWLIERSDFDKIFNQIKKQQE